MNFDEIEDCMPEGGNTDNEGNIVSSAQWLHDFAKNVAIKEREACGEIANQKAAKVLATNTHNGRTGHAASFAAGMLEDVGAAIRARSND